MGDRQGPKPPLGSLHEAERLEAAARAIHTWQSVEKWEAVDEDTRARARQQARWVLQAADAQDTRAGVRRAGPRGKKR
jgi:hypothetical protein